MNRRWVLNKAEKLFVGVVKFQYPKVETGYAQSVIMQLNAVVECVPVINHTARLKRKVPMKQDSRRAKGRLLQIIVRDKILKAFPHLKPEDVIVAKHGQNGEDIKLSRIAKRLIQHQFECKNQQKLLTLYKFFRQAQKYGKLNPVLIVKLNSRKPLAVIDLDHFISLIK